MKLVTVLLIAFALALTVEAAKRIKVCDVTNGESPNRKIYFSNCAGSAKNNIYYCGTGDASNKGDWQTCTKVQSGESHYQDMHQQLDYNCDDDDGNKLFIAAFEGNKKDALCIEAIDMEDVLTTFCDNLVLAEHDGAFSNGAGNCETFGWGLLKEYQRLWIEEESDRCGGYWMMKGGNGQEVNVFGTSFCP